MFAIYVHYLLAHIHSHKYGKFNVECRRFFYFQYTINRVLCFLHRQHQEKEKQKKDNSKE